MKLLRSILGGLFVISMGVYAIRAALVEAYIDDNPARAASFWPGHPDAIAAMSMLEVAQAAAQGKSVPSQTAERLKELSAKSPLAPEPFLIAGASELRSQNYYKAEQLLIAGRQRGPRSPAARFLLSDLYLRQNQADPALEELVALNRILPSFGRALAPALAKYAQSAGATPRLRELLSGNSQLQASVLGELASDYRNAALIQSLAGPNKDSDSAPAWQQRLLSSLVTAGDYGQALALWRRLAPRTDTTRGLSNFERSSSPSPFTWTLAEGAAGGADPVDGGLRVRFTGRDNVTFASQVALLPPGPYLMSMQTSGSMPPDGSVTWSVSCLPEGPRLASVPLTQPGRPSARFDVGPSCNAQKIELVGAGQTFPEPAEFSLFNFDVTRFPGR